mmetsp:Transcript_9029/g.18438  ORF Transcript_9029/g.18438 Transcript_9029/m.18438 type:complete len:256 (-) Transcript_9029:1807-2574(-)
MGAAPSRYGTTDWDGAASGGLSGPSDTVSGDAPTTSHTKVKMAPKRAVIGQTLPVVGQLMTTREYDVIDASDNTIFTTQSVPKLASGFDLVRDDVPVLRVDSTFSNRTWNVYTIDEPVFEGQKPIPEATAKTGVNLYRKATIVFEKGTADHHALVYMFRASSSDDVDTVLVVERCKEGMTDVHWHFQTSLPPKGGGELASQPLVGYWKWAGSNIPLTMDDKIEMELVQGSDLALHVILAIVSTIERASLKAEYSG